MSYVPEYARDVFITYAYADETARRGFVGHCYERLRDLLLAKVPKCKVFLDSDNRALATGSPVPPQITGTAKRSAVLVLFYSAAYKGSDWCKRELHEFCNGGGKYVHVLALDRHTDSRRDIFTAISQRKPRRLYGTKTDSRGEADFSHLPSEETVLNADNRTLEEELSDLADEIAGELQELREISTARRVHVAWWRADVEAYASELIDRLEVKQFVVTRTSHVVLDIPEELEKSLEQVARADLYIEMMGSPKELPDDKAKVLRALSERAGEKTLRWFSKTHAVSPEFSTSISHGNEVAITPTELFERVWKTLERQEENKRQPTIPAQVVASGGLRRHVLVVAVNRQRDGEAVASVETELLNYRQSHNVGQDAFFIEESVDGRNLTVLTSEWLTPMGDRLKRDRASGIVFLHSAFPGAVMDQLLRDFLYAKAEGAFSCLRAAPGVCDFPPRPKTDRFYRPPPTDIVEFDNDTLDRIQVIATA